MGRLSRGRAFYARTGSSCAVCGARRGAMGGAAVNRGGKGCGHTPYAVMLPFSLFVVGPERPSPVRADAASFRSLLYAAFSAGGRCIRPGSHFRQKADITAGYRICYAGAEEKVRRFRHPSLYIAWKAGDRAKVRRKAIRSCSILQRYSSLLSMRRGAHPSNGASPFHSVGTVACRSFFTGVWPLCSCRLPLLYIPPCWLSP